MFNKALSEHELTLVSEIANEIYPLNKIYGCSFNSDFSFIATLRAIVAPRMSE